MSGSDSVGGGFGDILSMALKQTGVESVSSPQVDLANPNGILNEAAGAIDVSLLSSDIGSLTKGLFSSLSGTNAVNPCEKTPVSLSNGTALFPMAHSPVSGLRSVPTEYPNPLIKQESAGLDFLPDNVLDLLSDGTVLSGNNSGLSGDSVPHASVSQLSFAVPPIATPPTHPTFLTDMPMQTDTGLDDDLSDLLNSTGAEYLESLAQESDSKLPLFPPTPIPSISTVSVRDLINTSARIPPGAAASVATTTGSAVNTSSLKFDVEHVLSQLGGRSSAGVSIAPPSLSTPGTLTLPAASFNIRVASRPSLPTPVASVIRPASLVSAGGSRPPSEQVFEESDDDDDFSAADTYANYRPSKLHIGYVHPDPIVESSSLSSVEAPQVWFDLKLPSHVVEEVRLSSLQLEAVVYSCQQHMNLLSDGSRAGFFVGDGAGVGKGRTIAGIIFQNYLEGRKKALWLSVSNDLKYDAMRDLRDVGAKKISVYSLNKFHYGKISGKRNGRVRKGVVFATYSSLIGQSSSGGKYRTRFNQLLHWMGPQFEGVIVFDECHKAKNLVPTGSGKPSKTGLTVLQLQKRLPKARIVYCSATGASEPRNMAYMSRLGIWGPGTQFPSFLEFIKAVERRGVGAMEIVAMDMKLRGMYMARQLSFTGVSFDIEEVALSSKFVEMYDLSVELWMEARRLFQEASDLLDVERKSSKTMWGQFWASHQRFFKYLCIAAKVPQAIRLAKKALLEGKCVVIGLQSTGEARTLEQLEQNDGELSGFISTAKGVLETLIRRHFPTPSEGINWNVFDSDPTLPENCRKRKRGEREATLFREDDPSSDDSSDGPEASDSAVESSSDEEGAESDSEGAGSSSDKNASDSSSDGEAKEDFNPFSEEPWLKPAKPRTKKRRLSPAARKKHKNFSIKPPPTSSRKGKTKTGFNSKSLKFEPVQSPKDMKKNILESRRQSIAVVEGIARSPSLKPGLERKPSLQPPPPSPSLIDLMSSSAMTTGSQSSLRNITVRKMKEQLLKKVEELGPLLPTNTLDELIDGLGGPSKVSEMTGRRGRVVSMGNGAVKYQLRSETDVSTEMLNIAEKQRFMDGEKNIAIISEAASSGISLQADRRVKNHKRRVHITLELPWSADKAIQQFGRTHRSNQVSAPEYVFLISGLSGEQRFASIVAKRLQSLGALTHGDRRATESQDLTKYNVDTKYGRQALEIVLKSILGSGPAMVKSEEYTSDFFNDCCSALVGVGLIGRENGRTLSIDKDAFTISRFLNRILGLSVKLQNQLFAYFTDTLAAVIQQAKKLGRWDGGILDFGASGEHVEIVEMLEFVGDPAFGTATTQLHKLQVERGMSFAEAVDTLNSDLCPGEGFYLSKRVLQDKQVAVLLKSTDPSSSLFQVYRPNTGRQARPEKLKRLLKKYRKTDTAEAEKWWKLQYESSVSVCNHAFWQGKCRLSSPGHQCEVGRRRRAYSVLSGSVLGVWTHVEGVFTRHSGHSNRMQIARVKTPSKRLVGILVPTPCVEDMKQTLARIAQQAEGGTSDNPIQLT